LISTGVISQSIKGKFVNAEATEYWSFASH
jgi:hypothetical protein